MSKNLTPNYTLDQVLGKGGMATVYLSFHSLLHNKVAIKVLHPEYVHNENIRKRFLAEARNMARMSHPNLVKVTDLIEQEDTVAFVMEYVEGETLKEYLERKGKLDDEDIRKLFSQMLEALDYVHRQQLVHRDIKPSNFMINNEGGIKLMDFGIAKNTDASRAEYTQTSTGMQMGTPMYMSPEQITETKGVTSKSDIYSLGVVLWQMVMGRKPYDIKTLSSFQLQLKIVQETLPLTHSSWDTIIANCTRKETDKRYASCTVLLQDIKYIPTSNRNSTGKSNVNTEDETVLIKNEEELPRWKKIRIGDQVWMSENLNIKKFRNGDPIPEAKTMDEWYTAWALRAPCCCNYNFDSSISKTYGKLYNYFAVSDKRGIAPAGWSVPTDYDWLELIHELGGTHTPNKNARIVQDRMIISKGLEFLPGGCLSIAIDGAAVPDNRFAFIGLKRDSYWWTSKNSDYHNAIAYFLRYSDGEERSFVKSIENMKNGYSIRCIKTS